MKYRKVINIAYNKLQKIETIRLKRVERLKRAIGWKIKKSNLEFLSDLETLKKLKKFIKIPALFEHFIKSFWQKLD